MCVCIDLILGQPYVLIQALKRLGFPDAPAPEYTGLKVLFCVAPEGVRPRGSAATFHQWLGDGAYALSASYGARGGGAQEMLALCYADDDPARENAG